MKVGWPCLGCTETTPEKPLRCLVRAPFNFCKVTLVPARKSLLSIAAMSSKLGQHSPMPTRLSGSKTTTVQWASANFVTIPVRILCSACTPGPNTTTSPTSGRSSDLAAAATPVGAGCQIALPSVASPNDGALLSALAESSPSTVPLSVAELAGLPPLPRPGGGFDERPRSQALAVSLIEHAKAISRHRHPTLSRRGRPRRGAGGAGLAIVAGGFNEPGRAPESSRHLEPSSPQRSSSGRTALAGARKTMEPTGEGAAESGNTRRTTQWPLDGWRLTCARTPG
mmetsp:Transcript_100661/g.290820  ORF Transcript_100661/g.290820 Transcript_100661/m.290820 type:complete len:283 (+) Transcript_100661:301-1149(+)